MISTKGRYALRFMADLAQHAQNGFVPLKDVADRQGISKKYLEILVKQLVQHQMLISASGKSGGYRLARKPEEYTVEEILEVMEGTLAPVACLQCEENVCPRKENCITLPMWKKYDEITRNFFGGITLQDLIDGRIEKSS